MPLIPSWFHRKWSCLSWSEVKDVTSDHEVFALQNLVTKLFTLLKSNQIVKIQRISLKLSSNFLKIDGKLLHLTLDQLSLHFHCLLLVICVSNLELPLKIRENNDLCVYKTSSFASAVWLQTNIYEVEFLAHLSLIYKRLLKFCIHFLIVEKIIYWLFRHKLSKTCQMLRLNVTKNEKKKVEKLLTVLVGIALLEKIHSRFFASCNQSWNCKSCMKKTAL